MKKIIPILTLIVGVGIGWGIASYQSRIEFKKFQQTWSPELREYITDAVRIGLILEEHMTEDEILEAASLGSKMVTDGNSQAYGKAFQSVLIMRLLEEGNVDEAVEASQSCLDRFVKKYDEGDFGNDINEEQAGKLSEAIKSANQ